MRLAALALLFLRVSRAAHDPEDEDYNDDDEETDEDEVGVRSGFDMFVRKLPGSLMLASSGNDTGIIRGTWSNNAIASTVYEFYQKETVITNGHNFGGWITGGHKYIVESQPLMPLKAGEGGIYPGTISSTQESNQGRLDTGLLMTKLWTSAIVRDNIVTTFGFILNRPNNPLTADLYTSLMILYDAIRLRRIQTLDVLPVLKRMSYSSPQEQFIMLFEELHRHVPAYLKSAVSVWVQALSEQRVDLNPVIRPGGGPSEVDFLASLEPHHLNVLEESMHFKRETSERASTSIKQLMGPLFSYVFSGLYDRSIELTQPLFALILLHLPLDQTVPQKDETERYLVDALRLNAIENWDQVVNSLSEGDMLDPVRLVTIILQGIARNKGIDQQIRRDSLYILPHIKACTSTYTNENYGVMSKVVGTPSIKLKLILDHITRLTYSQDLESLRDRLLDYIRHGYIAVESAIAGFIRYDYTTPYDVLIAILTRIQRRLPDLSSEMLGTVKALRAYLVFHNALSQSPSHFPADLIHVPSLLDAFCDPTLPYKLRYVSETLSRMLDEENIDWQSLIGDMPIAFCKTPRQCFVSIMRRAIDKDVVVSNRVVKLAQKLIDILNEHESTNNVCEPEEFQPTERNIQAVTTMKPESEETSASRGQPGLHGRSTSVTTYKSVTPLPTSSPLIDEDLNIIIHSNATLLDIIPKEPQLQEIIQIIQNNTIPELQQVVEYCRNKTQAEALLMVLQAILYHTPVEPNHTLESTILRYINFLISHYGLSHVRYQPYISISDTEFPAIDPSIFSLPANFDQRESLLPYTTPFTPKDYLMMPIREFITRADLLDILGDEFRPSEYPTKFLLLRALLEKAVATQMIQEDFSLHDLLSRYLKFLLYQAEVTKPSVNWMVILDALPHAKDDHEYRFFTLLRDFINSADMEAYIKDFEVRRYTTRGLLLQNLLRFLLTIKQIKEKIELCAAIRYFVDRVYLNGFGAKPVEYVLIKQRIIRRTINLQEAFQAINIGALNKQARKALKRIYKFFETEFQPPIHLANYDLMKHQTKGEWLNAYFTYLAQHPAINKKTRESFSMLVPYILFTGRGAESVD